MLTLLTSPASFGASAVPLPSLLFPPPISASWSGHGLSTVAATLSASASIWCGKRRPVGTSVGAGIEGAHAPAVRLINRPGSWRQLKAWFHRKVHPRRECASAVAASESGGERPQRVRTWFSSVWKGDAAKTKALAPLTPAGRRIPALSEAVPPSISPVKLPVLPALPIRNPLWSALPATVMGLGGGLPGHSGAKDEVPNLALTLAPQTSVSQGRHKPAALAAIKPCLTLRPSKPKRSVHFARKKLVQEYTRWHWKGRPVIDTELVGTPYEQSLKTVVISKVYHWEETERYIDPDECNRVNLERTKWIRDGPTGDEVDADGDVDMDD